MASHIMIIASTLRRKPILLITAFQPPSILPVRETALTGSASARRLPSKSCLEEDEIIRFPGKNPHSVCTSSVKVVCITADVDESVQVDAWSLFMLGLIRTKFQSDFSSVL